MAWIADTRSAFIRGDSIRNTCIGDVFVKDICVKSICTRNVSAVMYLGMHSESFQIFKLKSGAWLKIWVKLDCTYIDST